MTSRVEIHLPAAGRGTVKIDGRTLDNVRSVAIQAGVDAATILKVEFINVDIKLTGVVDRVVETAPDAAETSVRRQTENAPNPTDAPSPTSVRNA